GDVPRSDPATWDFRAWGLVERPLRLTWQEFLRLPRTEVVADFHCVTGWSHLTFHWEGVLFSTLAGLARPRPDATHILVHAEGDYTTNLPLKDALDEDVLFAFKVDGHDLEPIHGAPLRLVVPKKYAYKSAKWVRGVEFAGQEVLGYWEARGYSSTADPWKEERYSS
ncbi:MAG: molybdopterin-dependent oxidoreductase, partial [Chloroflexota bacterium]|nr:molybdopterin-dependent oxidoreductase [Chloroflexota bacterium]